MSVKFCSGLDLGQAADFSCLVIIQKEVVNLEPEPQNSVDREALKMMAAGCMRVPQGMSVIDMCPKPPPKTETRYSLRYLKRGVLGSSYPAIVRHVSEIFSKPPL